MKNTFVVVYDPAFTARHFYFPPNILQTQEVRFVRFAVKYCSFAFRNSQ